MVCFGIVEFLQKMFSKFSFVVKASQPLKPVSNMLIKIATKLLQSCSVVGVSSLGNFFP